MKISTRETAELIGEAAMALSEAIPRNVLKNAAVQIAMHKLMQATMALMHCEEETLDMACLQDLGDVSPPQRRYS